MRGDPPLVGDFVELRGRQWLVEGRRSLFDGALDAVRLACVNDDVEISVEE